MKYQLIRSARRKTIALQVVNAEVIVRVPTYVELTYVDKLIQTKRQWLNKKIAAQKQHALLAPQLVTPFSNHNLTDKPSIFIDGLAHSIVIDFGKKNIVQIIEEKLIKVVISERYRSHDLSSKFLLTKVKSQIEHWLKFNIEAYINEKLRVLSSELSLYPTSFKVKKYKARWGSCNSRGELSFNYLLKMVPPWVIDYVIIHELCHLKYMNHSANFWQLVASHCPDYKNAKNWLCEHQPYLRW